MSDIFELASKNPKTAVLLVVIATVVAPFVSSFAGNLVSNQVQMAKLELTVSRNIEDIKELKHDVRSNRDMILSRLKGDD